MKRISSSLKSVGLSSTRTPLASVQRWTPSSSISSISMISAGSGRMGTSGASVAASTYASIPADSTAAKTPSSSSSVGTATPSFSGPSTRITRLFSVIHSRASRFTSTSATAGSSCWCVSYS